MRDKDKEIEGEVVEMLPNLLYRVRLKNTEREVICYMAGRLKVNKIKILLGDKVRVLLDPYGGKATNRIVYRL